MLKFTLEKEKEREQLLGVNFNIVAIVDGKKVYSFTV